MTAYVCLAVRNVGIRRK